VAAAAATAGRPGPAAHTQLSNIRGGPRWPPRSYKACLASVSPLLSHPVLVLVLPASPSGPAAGHTYEYFDGKERVREKERERREYLDMVPANRPGRTQVSVGLVPAFQEVADCNEESANSVADTKEVAVHAVSMT